MAEDIKENAMSGGTPARLRGLDANGNSISPTLAEVENALPKMSCIYHKVWTASKGDLLVVKSSYSIFMVGDSASGSHIMGILPIHHFHPHSLQVCIQCFYITIKVSGDKDLAFPLL